MTYNRKEIAIAETALAATKAAELPGTEDREDG
jgi:hypothetical protein